MSARRAGRLPWRELAGRPSRAAGSDSSAGAAAACAAAAACDRFVKPTAWRLRRFPDAGVDGSECGVPLPLVRGRGGRPCASILPHNDNGGGVFSNAQWFVNTTSMENSEIMSIGIEGHPRCSPGSTRHQGGLLAHAMAAERRSPVAARHDINLGYEHRCTRTGGATPPRPPATLSG